MTWDEALTALEDCSGGLAEEVSGAVFVEALGRRGEAIEHVSRLIAGEEPPKPGAAERIRKTLASGEEAMHKLRLARAAARGELAKLNGTVYVLRGMYPGAPTSTLDVEG